MIPVKWGLISGHHTEHLKYMQPLSVNYNSIKLEQIFKMNEIYIDQPTKKQRVGPCTNTTCCCSQIFLYVLSHWTLASHFSDSSLVNIIC